MRRFLTLALVPLLAATPAARAEEPLVQKVRTAMNDGVVYLKKQQKNQGGGDHNWEDPTLGLLQPGGSSNLAMLALLTAGVPVDDPAVRLGLPYIRGLKPQNTYVVGLQTMVLAEVGDQIGRAHV